MIWTVVEELLPEYAPELADIRDELKSKFSLKKLLEFLYEKFKHQSGDIKPERMCNFC